MGSGSSKPAAAGGGAGAAGGGSGGRGGGGDDGEKSGRWRGEKVLALACLCLPSSPATSDDEQEKKKVRRRDSVCTEEAVIKSDKPRPKGCRKFTVPCPGQATCSRSSGAEPNEDCHESTSYAELGDGVGITTQVAAITRSSSSSNNSCSRFGFIPDRIVSRLSRAASARSSGARSSFSAQIPQHEDRVLGNCDGLSSSRNGINEGHIAVDTESPEGIIRSNMDAESGGTRDFHWSNVRSDNFERRSSRRHGLQDPLEGSIRFSRTLSVGRLRDRVLRRSSFSDGLFDPLSLGNRLAEYRGDGTGRRALRRNASGASYDSGTDMFTASTGSLSSTRENNHDYESETPQLREASNRDTLEHRSAFLERRRRIRSQVRALQRLGSRVENIGRLIEHERSCILSGRHRTGRCTCRIISRPANPSDDTSTRSSISRIVMLAEALFEVLDEIHQQAVVLASRPSVSSIGSVPAPKEVVERMPLRIYGKSQPYHTEEASQCYICLVEYEEGDYVRILPCRHEFHRICVDKWLKEIHRVCPLCRGDVCVSDAPHVEKHS